jgi:hypothetical protein
MIYTNLIPIRLTSEWELMSGLILEKVKLKMKQLMSVNAFYSICSHIPSETDTAHEKTNDKNINK